MENVYGNTAASGEGGSANILNPGLHKVYIESIEKVSISTSKYNGDAADIKIVGVNGGTLSHRIFPFAF